MKSIYTRMNEIVFTKLLTVTSWRMRTHSRTRTHTCTRTHDTHTHTHTGVSIRATKMGNVGNIGNFHLNWH